MSKAWMSGALTLFAISLSNCAPTPAPAPAAAAPSGSSTRNTTFVPSVRLQTSFLLDCWAASGNGSVTTAGNTLVLNPSDELEIVSSTDIPAPFTEYVIPPGITSDAARGAGFGGAACISFNVSSNSTSAIVALGDYNAHNDPSRQQSAPVLNDSICTSTNCTTTRTTALNSTGRYYFIMVNPGQSWAQVAISYSLHGTGDPACQNINQKPPAAYPAPFPSNLTSLVRPALLNSLFLDSSGFLAPVGSFRGTTCLGAQLASTVSFVLKNFTQTRNVSLLLLDTLDFEIALNRTALGSLQLAGGCSAGASTNLCTLVAGGLNPLEHYYMYLLYPGEPYTTQANATINAISVNAAFTPFNAGTAALVPACGAAGPAMAPDSRLGPSVAPQTVPTPAPSGSISKP